MVKTIYLKKGQLVKDAYGVVDKPGARVRLKYTYRTNADGEVLTGKQIIDGTEYVFASDGHVVDGVIGYDRQTLSSQR